MIFKEIWFKRFEEQGYLRLSISINSTLVTNETLAPFAFVLHIHCKHKLDNGRFSFLVHQYNIKQFFSALSRLNHWYDTYFKEVNLGIDFNSVLGNKSIEDISLPW